MDCSLNHVRRTKRPLKYCALRDHLLILPWLIFLIKIKNILWAGFTDLIEGIAPLIQALFALFNENSQVLCFSQNSAGMERSEASVISARFIMCLVFAGLVEGAGKFRTLPAKCRKLPCDKVTFDAAAYEYCVKPFTQTMANTDYQFNCPWPSTRSNYINLMLCLEKQENSKCCTGASNRHHILLEIHKVYFSMCSYKEDPGVPILLLLIAPCAIVPFIIPFLCQHFKLHEYRLPNKD